LKLAWLIHAAVFEKISNTANTNKWGFFVLERKRMLKLEMSRVFVYGKIPHLLKLCLVRNGPRQDSMDNPSQFQGMVYFNVCAVY